MQNIKLIIHESYVGKLELSEVFLKIFLLENSELTELKIDSRICVNDQFQDLEYGGKSRLDYIDICINKLLFFMNYSKY